MTAPDIISLLPATCYTDPRFPGFFTIGHSPNGIPLTEPQSPLDSIWNYDPTDHAFVDTPEFYQCLMGPNPPIHPRSGFDIATGLELSTLVTCSDGSFNPDSGKGSLG
jgi:hypothetical protein